MDYQLGYRELLMRLVQRDLTIDDGLSAAAISAAEQRLGLVLPLALRDYYRVAGRLDEVNRCHNRLFSLDELAIADDYLMFMEENQDVVSWGVQVGEIERADPEVWQRVNNSEAEWFVEKERLAKFLCDMMEWQMSFED